VDTLLKISPVKKMGNHKKLPLRQESRITAKSAILN
jgi:hypothetical protein